MMASMETLNLGYAIAGILAGFAVLRGAQAIAEHYFPNTEAVMAARFILGGPG